jgi:hypothetical protein
MEKIQHLYVNNYPALLQGIQATTDEENINQILDVFGIDKTIISPLMFRNSLIETGCFELTYLHNNIAIDVTICLRDYVCKHIISKYIFVLPEKIFNACFHHISYDLDK